MPELPEVETSVRGISPFLENQVIHKVQVRDRRLRWPIPETLPAMLAGKQVRSIWRRAKYIVLETYDDMGILIHLGMSGSVRIVQDNSIPKKHDHFDIILKNGTILRYHDPRRFGCALPFTGHPQTHALIANLGVEPLSEQFTAQYLYALAKKRNINVKNFIMNAHIVVGVGNIYASESLFYAGIHPKRKACNISQQRYEVLVKAIKNVLANAILQGGTTLNDFVNADGKPGYFQQTLSVYGRTGQPCQQCAAPIKSVIIAQRSSFYCATCQH